MSEIKCPHCGGELNIGALLGSVSTPAKARAARRNAKLGGWPKGKKRGKRKPTDPNVIAHGVVGEVIKRTEQPPEPQASPRSRRGSKRGRSIPPPSRE